MMAIYLYGFLDCLPEGRAQPLEQAAEFRMDERFGVESLALAGSSALICEVDEDGFRHDQLPSPDWLAARACRHAGLLCSLVRDCAVLPAKFGTLFSSVRQLRSAVDEPAIAAALGELRGKAEWSVKLMVDEQAVAALLRERDPMLRSRRARLSSSPGARYLQARQLDQLLAVVLGDHLRERAGFLRQAVARLATAVTPLRGPTAASGATVVCQLGVLLDWSREPGLQAELDVIAQSWAAEGAWIELGGPWPAYDFCPAYISERVSGAQTNR